MQEHNNKLALRRDCTQAWPPSDGIVFKIQQSILCGATCILDDQGAPVIFGETQRILHSDVSKKTGRYKAVILQWLPNPIDVRKLLDQDRWATLGVVRGLSQGFEDSAVTTMGLYAVHDYLCTIDLDPSCFLLVYRSLWFTDRNAQRPRAPVEAKANLGVKPSSRKQEGVRIPELLLCIVFLGTADDCPDGSMDETYMDLRQQFHNFGVCLGPVSLCHWGFHLEVLASFAACKERPWRRLDSIVDTHCTVIPGIQGKCLAKDLLAVIYGACGEHTYNWQALFDICCVIMIPSQRNRYGSASHARALLVWEGMPTKIPLPILRPLEAQGPLGRYFDSFPGLLPGLKTYIQAGDVAGRPPPRICITHPEIYSDLHLEPMSEGSGAINDSDDIYVESGPGLAVPHSPNVTVSYYGNSFSRVEAFRRGGRGDSGTSHGSMSTNSGDARQHGRDLVTNSRHDETAPPTKRINHGGNVPATIDGNLQLVPLSSAPPVPQDIVVRKDSMANAVSTQQDNTALMQAFAAMLSAQLGTTMQAMAHQQEITATAARRHMEYTVQRAALETSARAMTAEGDQIARDTTVARSNANDTTSAAWYCQQQGQLVMALDLRAAQLELRKSALERQYQLLNDAHEDVGVRPSLW